MIEKLLVARNEIENVISDISRELEISEEEMILIIDAVSNTVRHKALTRSAYMAVKKAKEEKEKD